MMRWLKVTIAAVALVLITLNLLSYNNAFKQYNSTIAGLTAPAAPVAVQSNNRYINPTPAANADITDTAWFNLSKSRDELDAKTKQAALNMASVIGSAGLLLYLLKDTRFE